MLLLNLLAGFTGLAIASPGPLRAARDAATELSRRADAPAYKAYTIDQPIDHFPHSPKYAPHTKDTFKQRYFFDSSYYKPGGPVYLYISGETSGESRFSNLQTGIIQILMQATNGLGVILENRFYGESFPYNTSSTDELAYLTTEQTIADNEFFAKNAVFPGVNATDLTAPGTPWILYGGSLAGAQTAFSVKTYGDLLYGGIASSGVIKTFLEYPEWYLPIQKFGPSDCTASINNIIDKLDHLIATKNTGAIQTFKSFFGLEKLEDIRDFAMTIAFPLGGPMNYPTSTWQELNWYPAYSAEDFFHFCSNVTNLYAPESITAIDYVLSNYTGGEPWTGLGNYANYFKQVVLPLCETGDVNSALNGCFGTQNQTFYADVTNGAARSYLYSTCTEQGVYQVAPKTGPSLISRVLQVDYTQQWCTWAFPPGKYNSIPSTPNVDEYNKYGGYNFSADRLAFIDGSADVWNEVCYHSSMAPPRYSSDLHPEYFINGAGHHWDSSGIKNISAEPDFIREAHLWEIRTVKKWLAKFPEWKPKK